MGLTLNIIAGTLAATRPDAAAIILGAAQAHVIELAGANTQPITSTVATALGEERARALGARGADMDWDQAIAYTLTQITHALGDL
jgi:hypothetical protein